MGGGRGHCLSFCCVSVRAFGASGGEYGVWHLLLGSEACILRRSLVMMDEGKMTVHSYFRNGLRRLRSIVITISDQLSNKSLTLLSSSCVIATATTSTEPASFLMKCP